MYFSGMQTLIVIVLTLIVILLAAGLFWTYNKAVSPQHYGTQLASDLTNIREILTQDSHLNRLLMIEIIGDKTPHNKDSVNVASPKTNNLNEIGFMPIDSSRYIGHYFNPEVLVNTMQSSEAVTFNKMSSGIYLLGKALVRSFGITIAQKLATLMHKRNEILREYYWSLRNVVCYNGNYVVVTGNHKGISGIDRAKLYLEAGNDMSSNNIKHERSLPQDQAESDKFNEDITGFLDESNDRGKSVFPSYETLDIITITQRKLEAITREITDNIASSFHIRDIDQTSNKNRPIVHFQRLFNLITMYDKELVNQAKSYASRHYDISINCTQSCLEITHHISDELSFLMKESQQKSKAILLT